ncbi:hypothetical protein JCM10207_006813 [Rhodosporidiobolus poonsookiae]
MLDRLPLELVELIVLLALPSPDSPLSYYDRQDTLRALCLVSRHIRSAAQPILFQQVRLATRRAAQRFPRVAGRNGSRVKELWVGPWRYEGGRPEPSEDLELRASKSLANLAQACSQTEEVYLRLSNLDMHSVQRFSALSRCNLGQAQADLFHWPNHITTLSLDGSTVLDAPQTSLLSSHERVMLDWTLVDTVDTYEESVALRTVRNLRIQPHAFALISSKHSQPHRPHDALYFYLLTTLLSQPGNFTQLPSLYLASFLNRPEYLLGVELSSAISSLLATCASRSIEVIFEHEPHPSLDSFISPTFLKRCEVIKAAEKAAAAEAREEEEDGKQ